MSLFSPGLPSKKYGLYLSMFASTAPVQPMHHKYESRALAYKSIAVHRALSFFAGVQVQPHLDEARQNSEVKAKIAPTVPFLGFMHDPSKMLCCQ